MAGIFFKTGGSPWNDAIPASPPLLTGSAHTAMLNELTYQMNPANSVYGYEPNVNRESYSTAFNYVTNAAAKQDVILIDHGTNSVISPAQDAYDAGHLAWLFRKSLGGGVPISDTTKIAGGTDKATTIINTDTGEMFELWIAQKNSSGQWTCHWGGYLPDHRTNIGQYYDNGVTGKGRIYKNWGTPATSLPMAAGVITDAETVAVFNGTATDFGHAIGMQTGRNRGIGDFVWPAQRSDNWDWGSSPFKDGAIRGPIPEGQIIQLNPAFDADTVTGYQGNLQATRFVRAFIRTGQKYGFIVNDRATNVSYRAEDVPSQPGGGVAWPCWGNQIIYGVPWSQARFLDPSYRPASTPIVVDTTAPANPTTLTATGGTNQIVLDWADNTESDKAGYVVERSANSGANWTEIARPTASQYVDSGLPAATTYSYRVKARDTSGNVSGPGNVASATTAAASTPSTPTGTISVVGAVDNGATNYATGWTPGSQRPSATQSSDLILLSIRISTFDGDVTPTIPAGWTQIGTWTTDPGGGSSPGKSARFWLRDGGNNAWGTMAFGATKFFSASVVALRGVVTAGTPVELVGGFSANTQWLSSLPLGALTTSGSNRMAVAFLYHDGGSGDWTAPSGWVEDVDGNSAVMHTTAATASTIAAQTFSKASLGWLSGIALTVIPQAAVAADTTAPAAPTQLTATGGTETIAVDWANNAESDLAGYIVERSADGTTNWTEIARPTVSNYTDTITGGGARSYRVKAYDNAATPNVSAPSSSVRATATAPVIVTPPGGGGSTPSAGHISIVGTWRETVNQGTSVAVGKPVGVATDDLHLIQFRFALPNDVDETVTVPSTWTAVDPAWVYDALASSGSKGKWRRFWVRENGAALGTISWTSNWFFGVNVLTLRGVIATGNPIEAKNSVVAGFAGSVGIPGLTTLGDNRLLVVSGFTTADTTGSVA